MDVLRSLLFVPAANPRALEKARALPADAVILDLEDSAAPEAKPAARDAAMAALTARAYGHRAAALRVNGRASAWFADDLRAAASCPDCPVLIPKVSGPEDLQAAREALQTDRNALWAMIETPQGLMNLKEIAACAEKTGLEALICGPNDLAAALRLPHGGDKAHRDGEGRAGLVPHLAAIVLAARAHGLAPYDGVFNDFTDADGFAAEARQGRALGFDGKTLIHPGQIEPANEIFSPGQEELDWARAVVSAFAGASRGQDAIPVGGKMVERMHLARAEALLARHAAARAHPK